MAANNILITEKAAQQIKSSLADAQRIVRIDAAKGGCSGYRYTLDPTDSVLPSDAKFSSQGLTIIVDKDRLDNILGSLEIDFQDGNLIEQGFTFTSISTSSTNCGCGKSFSAVANDR